MPALCMLYNFYHGIAQIFENFVQVILQSETIQELTKTSQALALAQNELFELQKLSDAQKTEYVCTDSQFIPKLKN